MRTILLLQLLIVSFSATSQCSPTNFPTDIYYSNSNNTPTNVSGPEYLCGPNTIVYDTVEIGCRFVYANAFSTLYFKPTLSCATASYIWLKSNSILNLVQGTGPTFVIHELGAVINNPFGVTISSSTCAAITFPIVNCTPTALGENGIKNEGFDIFPNPANDILNIRFNIVEQSKSACFFIYNSIGELVSEDKIIITDNRSNIATRDLKSGFYFLVLKNENTTLTRRFVIDHL